MNPFKKVKLLLCVIVVCMLSAGCGNQPQFHNTDISGAPYGKDFALLDPDGKTRQLADFRGKAVMVFFGFIHCPDVCPTALARAVQVQRLLRADADRFQVIFITLDPERDTPEILREYTAAFGANILGLHETSEKTREIAKAFRIFYRKVPTHGSYTIDHTAISYIYDPQGSLRLAVAHKNDAESIAADVALLLQQEKPQ